MKAPIRLAFLAVLIPVRVSSSLGGDVASVQTDREHMRGALRAVTRTEAYAVHEMRAASGTIVREYVGPSGTVFAVAWQGPWLPDLRQVLGDYFDRYQQAARAARARSTGHGPLVVDDPGLFVQIVGHPRAFSGKAYVPQLMPAGVQPESIR